MLAGGLAPLVGVLFLGWSLLELVLVIWIEGAVLLLFGVARFAVRAPLVALLVGPPYLLIAGIFMVLQLAMLVVAFTLAEAKADFFGFVEGFPAMLRRVLWAGSVVLLGQLVGLWAFVRDPAARPPAWRLLLAPTAHVAILQAFVPIAGWVAQRAELAGPALALLVVAKALVDVALWLLDERLAQGTSGPLPGAAH